MRIQELVDLLLKFKDRNVQADKEEVKSFFTSKIRCKEERSVVVTETCAFRFSEANTGSFSNVVLSLSALKKHDNLPLILCIVRPESLDFRLINSTFIKKVSHSSHKFTSAKTRGSFLGHDVLTRYEEIENIPANFEGLFLLHREFTWEDNVARLLESTNGIKPTGSRAMLSVFDVKQIQLAPDHAEALIQTTEFKKKSADLTKRVEMIKHQLLEAAKIDNVNLRGNKIEELITGRIAEHRLDDLEYRFSDGSTLTIDVKAKLLNLASAPKAYNIDKMLRLLSSPKTAFFFLFIGIDVEQQKVSSRLVSIFDSTIIKATRIQTLWAGRASRGVTQLSGNFSCVLEEGYRQQIDVAAARTLLSIFIEQGEPKS